MPVKTDPRDPKQNGAEWKLETLRWREETAGERDG